MNKYEIVVESSADLNSALREKYGLYSDYIHNIIYLPDREKLADLDFSDIGEKEWFALIKKNGGKVKTSFATLEEFKRVIEPILKDGKDVIVPALSTGISGTVNGYRNWADVLLEDYPERKIEIIDSLRYGAGLGLLSILMGINKQEGMSFEDNIKYANIVKYTIHEAGPMDDLMFLSKSGRIKAAKAFFGSLASVQPIADFTFDGRSEPLGTVAKDKAVNKVSLEYMLKTATDLKNQIVIISHSDRLERAELFKKQLLEVCQPKEVIILSLGQTCGVNVGPGLCAYFYLGDKITETREIEVKTFNDIKASL